MCVHAACVADTLLHMSPFNYDVIVRQASVRACVKLLVWKLREYARSHALLFLYSCSFMILDLISVV